MYVLLSNCNHSYKSNILSNLDKFIVYDTTYVSKVFKDKSEMEEYLRKFPHESPYMKCAQLTGISHD